MQYTLIRTGLLALLATSSLASATGCDLIKKAKGDKVDTDPSGTGASTTTSNDTPAPAGKPGAGCALPEGDIEADFTIKKDCTVAVKAAHYVKKNATLHIEPGAKLLFDSDTFIWVEEGRIIAKGTEKEPILFSSGLATKAAGDWVGLGFDEKTNAGAELTWCKIEYAGRQSNGGEAAITIREQRSSGRIAITNTTFIHNDQAAIKSEKEKGGFLKFEKNTFKDNKISLDIHAAVLGTLGAGNSFGDPVNTYGDIHETVTWPALDSAINVTRNIVVAGEKAPAMLTIAPRSTVKIGSDVFIATGDNGGGGLIAHNVTFTSSNPTPHEGDWVAIFIYPRATTVELDACTFEYGGRQSQGGEGVISFYTVEAKKLKGVKITNCKFSHNSLAAIYSSDHDCGDHMKAGNKSDGVPLCRAPE